MRRRSGDGRHDSYSVGPQLTGHNERCLDLQRDLMERDKGEMGYAPWQVNHWRRGWTRMGGRNRKKVTSLQRGRKCGERRLTCSLCLKGTSALFRVKGGGNLISCPHGWIGGLPTIQTPQPERGWLVWERYTSRSNHGKAEGGRDWCVRR